MATNKVIYGNTTLIDLTSDTATESDVLSGKTFHSTDGVARSGSMDLSGYYSTSDTAETTIDDGDYFPFYDISATAKRKSLWSNIKSVLKTYFDTVYAAISSLDSWTIASQVQNDNTVTFTGLNDVYGYDLYCQNKLIGISAMSKTGSGTSVTIVYTVTGAASGDLCKLRILK